MIQQEIALSKLLDFDLRDLYGMRPARNPSSKPIRVVDNKQATASMRTKIVWLADQWGDAATHLVKDRLSIAEVASCLVFYDCGFAKAPKGQMVTTWFEELDQARRNVDNTHFGSALENEQLGSQQGTYCSQIEAAFPGYLHELYRKVGRDPNIMFRATFTELADGINKASEHDLQGRPPLHLSCNMLKVWFNAENGKVRKGWERPILTLERMKARVEWCKARKADLAASEQAPNSYH